ncbi:bile acid:sodium symporter [Musicola keenii]|uniref:bile acid:sodium symporter n=1 Tax=Musicola keenii TaxID=2884250 RepID=UPI00177FC5B7|nr:bile acid:sodium symporter [Musicola keenii]
MPILPTSAWSGWLDRRQIALYLSSMIAAALLAWVWPPPDGLAQAINPALALMLFATFLPLPLSRLRQALRHRRFLLALCVANFIAVPLLVAGLLHWVALTPVVAIGVAMVLLCPCVDYVVTFSGLGGADSRLLLAATPLLLLLQMLLLPVWLTLLFHDAAIAVSGAPFLAAFLTLIALPLGLAGLCQRWGNRSPTGARINIWLGILPVPATAVVLVLVTAFVTPQLAMAGQTVRQVLPVYLLFAMAMPAVGWMVARGFGLDAPAARAIVFSVSTRNALVILPLALTVPGAMPLMPAVVVTQTLVELLAQLVYIRWTPRMRFER